MIRVIQYRTGTRTGSYRYDGTNSLEGVPRTDRRHTPPADTPESQQVARRYASIVRANSFDKRKASMVVRSAIRSRVVHPSQVKQFEVVTAEIAPRSDDTARGGVA
jgi:hypothetical protein